MVQQALGITSSPERTLNQEFLPLTLLGKAAFELEKGYSRIIWSSPHRDLEKGADRDGTGTGRNPSLKELKTVYGCKCNA